MLFLDHFDVCLLCIYPVLLYSVLSSPQQNCFWSCIRILFFGAIVVVVLLLHLFLHSTAFSFFSKKGRTLTIWNLRNATQWFSFLITVAYHYSYYNDPSRISPSREHSLGNLVVINCYNILNPLVPTRPTTRISLEMKLTSLIYGAWSRLRLNPALFRSKGTKCCSSLIRPNTKTLGLIRIAYVLLLSLQCYRVMNPISAIAALIHDDRLYQGTPRKDIISKSFIGKWWTNNNAIPWWPISESCITHFIQISTIREYNPSVTLSIHFHQQPRRPTICSMYVCMYVLWYWYSRCYRLFLFG